MGRLDVVGPAGTGKSVLLHALADVMERAGHTVLRELPEPGRAVDARAALLVDDAHRLSPADLTRLTTLAGGEVGVLVVAHRPWPRPDGMSALGAALAVPRAPLVLGALDRSGVQARVVHVLGDRAPRPSDAVIDLVLTQTGGHPALVDRMLAALIELGGADPTRWRWDPSRPPSSLLAQLGYGVHRLPDGVRDLLRVRALGAPLEPDLLVPVLGVADPAALDELVEAARAEGLLTAEGAPIPLVSAAVLERTPPATRLELRRALAERELERGGNVLAAARRLLGTGVSGARVAGVFTAAGDESLRTGLPGADELYGAAVGAGAPAVELASRRAEAALRSGDLDLALTQADQVLSAAGQVRTADLAQAATVAAAVLAHRGMLARSAAVYRFLGARMGREAVPALIGTGALDEARAVLAAPLPNQPPTLLAGAEELMAHGLVNSVTGSPTAALSELTRAAVLLESSHRAALLPDTPAALAALTAVQCGELDVAQSVLERATRVRLGGRAMAVRHRLLLGWIALLRGRDGRGQGRPHRPGRARAARRVRRRRARGGDRPPHGRPRRPHARLGPRPRGDRAPSRRPVRAAAAGRARHRRRPAPGDQLDPPAPGRGRRAPRPARQPRGVGGPVALGGAAGGDRRRVARGGDAAARRPWSRPVGATGTRPRWPRRPRTGWRCWTPRSTPTRSRRPRAGCTPSA